MILILLLATISAMRYLLNFSFSLMIFLISTFGADEILTAVGALGAMTALFIGYLLGSGCFVGYFGIFFLSISQGRLYK